MSATQVSPSHSIESSLLHHAPASSPSFTQPDSIAQPSPTPTPTPTPTPHPDMSAPAPPPPPPPPADEDAMEHQPSPPPQPIEQPQDHDRMLMDVDTVVDAAHAQDAADPQPASPPPPPQSSLPAWEAESTPAPQAPQVLVAVQSAPEPPPAGSDATSPSPPHPDPDPDPGRPAPAAADPAGERDGEDHPSEDFDEDDDEDDDDQSDDEDDFWGGDRHFLEQLKEDTSTPSEEELKDMGHTSERTALDNVHWESSVYTSLDDPEYVPAESGRITWTLQGFHGTKDAPNKQRIMRSPPVNIGGFRWNLKIFPHGNEGTDHVSVYVECTGEEGSADPKVVQADDVSMQGMPSEEPTSPDEAKPTEEVAADPSIDGSFEIAAQIGCVMYNPKDPRVHTFEKATHQFHNGSKDWGWVRYYGPWTGLHRRRPYQHQAMLRDDTLCFTAFVRIVKDPTRALWFKQTDQVIWDSVLRTGLRGLMAEESAGNAVVAALVPWLHLYPFKKLIMDTPTPDRSLEPRKRLRPLLRQLQEVMYQKHCPENHSPGYPVSLYTVKEILTWYGLQCRQATDVVEIWEMLRDTLNSECNNESKFFDSSDVLSFMNTIKRDSRPSLPCDSPTQETEPRSVQELVNLAHNPEQKSYVNWNGRHPSASAHPEVLQIELNRQRYDASTRKWKKLTHQIKMEEKINVGNREYTLFAMVISKGELGSGRVYSIVRSGDASSRWARYKGGSVTYITRKQAVDSHEGKGHSRDGSESVAYLVLYVRTDVAEAVLPTPTVQPTSKVLFPLVPSPSLTEASVLKPDTLPVIVHSASKLLDHSGPGFIDAWTVKEQNLYQVNVPPTANLVDVQRALVDEHGVAERPDQCRLWPIQADTISWPRLKQYDLMTQVSDLSSRFEGMHFWMYVIPMEELNLEGCFIEIERSDSDMPPTLFNLSPQPSIPPPEQTQAQDVVMGGTQEPLADGDNPAVLVQLGGEEIGDSITLEAPTMELVPSESVSGATIVPAPPSAVPVLAEPTAPATTTQAEPTQAEPTPSETVPVDSASKEPAVSVKTEKIPEWQLSDHIYIMLKVFDPRKQSITGLGSCLLPRKTQVSDAIETLAPPALQASAVYHEFGNSIDSELSMSSSLESSGLCNGSVLVVASGGISENDLEILRDRGDAADARDYYDMLSIMKLYSYRGTHLTRSYFGGAYIQTPLYKGRAFGECKIIETTGDAYLGNCVRGLKSGKGTMYYANGNTYTGDWANSLPDGQGTMLYNPTGNTYIGSWRAGRKHGKGVMTFEVADEEMQLCKICYESEMDALFYRCGHVAACEACARQVRDCPVCRRQVDAVVKIWRT